MAQITASIFYCYFWERNGLSKGLKNPPVFILRTVFIPITGNELNSAVGEATAKSHAKHQQRRKMMSKTFENLNQIGIVNNDLYASGIDSGLFKYSEDDLIKISDLKVEYFFGFGDDLLFFQGNMLPIVRLDKNSHVYEVANGQFSFISLNIYPNSFFITERKHGKKVRKELNKDYEISEIRYNYVTHNFKNYGFTITGDKIEAFLKNSETTLWTFQAAECGFFYKWNSEHKKEIKTPNSMKQET